MDTIRGLVSDKEPTPNKFTIAMGELIRKAREEANLSQKELSEKIYRRQATLSDIETGKVEVTSGTLAMIASELNKPLSYFFPWFVYRKLQPEKFTPLHEEMLTYFEKIPGEELQKLMINLIKVFAKFDPTELVLYWLPFIQDDLEHKKEIQENFEKRHKK